jgi:hypothetical protein
MFDCSLQTDTEFYIFCNLLDNTVRFRRLTPVPTLVVQPLNIEWPQRLCWCCQSCS